MCSAIRASSMKPAALSTRVAAFTAFLSLKESVVLSQQITVSTFQ